MANIPPTKDFFPSPALSLSLAGIFRGAAAAEVEGAGDEGSVGGGRGRLDETRGINLYPISHPSFAAQTFSSLTSPYSLTSFFPLTLSESSVPPSPSLSPVSPSLAGSDHHQQPKQHGQHGLSSNGGEYQRPPAITRPPAQSLLPLSLEVHRSAGSSSRQTSIIVERARRWVGKH
ncbi:hypothetical protein Dimus_001929 [Dionaea muscipula]